MLLDFRRPALVELDHFVSSSGALYVFYGVHYVKGKPCWDVGYSNRGTGEIVRRHYNEDNNMAPEASAKTYWEEMKEKRHKIQRRELADEPTELEQIEKWLDIHEGPNWRGKKSS